MAQQEVVVLSGVRTAIGSYGGSLKDNPPTELGAAVVREAPTRLGNGGGSMYTVDIDTGGTMTDGLVADGS